MRSWTLPITLSVLLMSMDLGTVEIIGHRGARGERPENCLPSFQRALEASADGVELDLAMTKDGVIVVHHDYHVNSELCAYLDGRSIEERPLIRDVDLAVLKELDCGGKLNSAFPEQFLAPGTTIPTLDELFVFLNESTHPAAKKLSLTLEIKTCAENPEFTLNHQLFVAEILQCVVRNGFADRVLFSSFDPKALEAVRAQAPSARIGYLKEESLDGLLEAALALRADHVSPEDVLLRGREDVQRFHDHNLRVIPWTVNDPKRVQELIEMGIDGVITDYPTAMIALTQTTATRS